MAVQFKKGDTGDPYTVQLKDVDGPVDITGNTRVQFYMRNAKTGNKKVNGKTADVLNASEGRVEYKWDSEDVDTAGVFEAEFVVEFANGVETWPSNDFKSIKIGEDIEQS